MMTESVCALTGTYMELALTYPASAAAPQPRNRLLNALSPEDLAVLWPRLEPVDLPPRQMLQQPEEPMSAVYFVETGWMSMVATMEDGDGAEVGLVGYEGMLGLPLLLDDVFDDLEAMVQAPGTALRLPA